ncbi:MAG TPA: hypothetical protein DDW65_01190 [Firmicutes bacterium]|jgi:hypothetical protein|nr:hypothetical protein [Bacillota bacterium]
MALTTSHYPERIVKITAFITLFMAADGFAFPAGIGRMADIWGIHIVSLIVLNRSVLLVICSH